ncbi:protease inhibitor I42 family protein [Phenylobacterium sp.]|uniref:protease inhibitor I42 family protein n=1 Tax=Phenylobacterium sp. TaxID=1871053 RepID=UPI0025E2EA2C|nr:protease inhibitor I42 family protein [Phenylobacterium sp.]
MATILLTLADDGRRLAVDAGGIVEVELQENPTTGYRWSPTVMPYGALDLLEQAFEPATGGGIGAGGRRRFRLRAVASGEAILRFGLRRAWEHADTTQRTAEFILQIG